MDSALGMKWWVGRGQPKAHRKKKNESFPENSSLSRWMPRIAETFWFPFLAQAAGLEGDSLIRSEQN